MLLGMMLGRRSHPARRATGHSRYAIGAVSLVCGVGWAAPAPTDAREFFEKQVRPILAAECYACHSGQAKSPFAGLRLDSRWALMRGSDAGPVIVPGKPEESKLI